MENTIENVSGLPTQTSTMMKETPQPIDINNLDLAPEEINVDENADAFGFPPPAPEGSYLFKLSIGRDGWKAGFANKRLCPVCNGSGLHNNLACPRCKTCLPDGSVRNTGKALYFMVHIIATHAEGKAQGKRVEDRASTMMMESGTSRVLGILAALGKHIPSRTTDLEIVKVMNAVLASEPFARALTQWQAYCSNCEENVTTGQKHFPQRPDGSPDPLIKCRKCGAECTARARIQRYLSV